MSTDANAFLPHWVTHEILLVLLGHMCGWRMPLQIGGEHVWTGEDPAPRGTKERLFFIPSVVPYQDNLHLRLAFPEGPQCDITLYHRVEEGACNMLNPNSSPLYVALFKKVVDTVGGSVLLNENLDELVPSSWYRVDPEKARWRPPQGTAQFRERAPRLLYEALTPDWILTAEDILGAAKTAHYGLSARCQEVCAAIETQQRKIQTYHALEKGMSHKAERHSRKRL